MPPRFTRWTELHKKEAERLFGWAVVEAFSHQHPIVYLGEDGWDSTGRRLDLDMDGIALAASRINVIFPDPVLHALAYECVLFPRLAFSVVL